MYIAGICENYLCIDSDSEFIRDFYYSDFMYNDNTPYTIMHESKGFLETMENIGLDSEKYFSRKLSVLHVPYSGTPEKNGTMVLRPICGIVISGNILMKYF